MACKAERTQVLIDPITFSVANAMDKKKKNNQKNNNHPLIQVSVLLRFLTAFVLAN